MSNPLSTTVSGLLGLNALELDMKYRSRFSNVSFDSRPSDSMSTVVLTKNSSLLGLERRADFTCRYTKTPFAPISENALSPPTTTTSYVPTSGVARGRGAWKMYETPIAYSIATTLGI